MEQQSNKLNSAFKKKKIITYTLLQSVGIIAIMLIGGCFDWLNMKFDISQFNTWKYWNGVIQQVLMYSIALIIGYLGRLQKEILSNDEFAISMNIYHAYFAQKTESFIRFIEKILNPRIREEYYIAHLDRKLYKLERKAHKHDSWVLEYDHYIDTMINDAALLNQFQFENDKSKKYVLTRFNLEQLKLEQNVTKNSKTFSDYPRVNPHAFTWGIRVKDNNSNRYKVENTTAKDMTYVFLRKALSVLLSALVLGTIASEASGNELLNQANGWIKLLIKYLIRVCAIIWSYGSGIYAGKGMFESNYLDVINNRNSIFEEYVTWKKTLNETDSEGFKIKQAVLVQQVKFEQSKQESSNNNKMLSNSPVYSLTKEEEQEALRKAKFEKEKNSLLEQIKKPLGN